MINDLDRGMFALDPQPGLRDAARPERAPWASAWGSVPGRRRTTGVVPRARPAWRWAWVGSGARRKG